MFGVNYYKADSTTFVIATGNGAVRRKGKGLSFFYSSVSTTIAAIPVNIQEAPFIFGQQTRDYQAIKVQGQVTFKIADAEQAAELLNFNLKKDGVSYVSEDPVKLGDRVVKAVQSIVQREIQAVTLREALLLGEKLIMVLKENLKEAGVLKSLGIEVVSVAITSITPTPETARALEAEAREAILQEADDAIYARRKSAVEQERIIKEAELQTDLSVQQKEQEIAESRIGNERAIMRGHAETEKEQLQIAITKEIERKQLVELQEANSRMEADIDAYGISAKLVAYKGLPVEYWKAMAMANMQADQLLALGFEALAQNANKIGEVNFSPDMFKQLLRSGK
jgi:regulator of protease activity HflC (stomatin/prohibitin superfamily)